MKILDKKNLVRFEDFSIIAICTTQKNISYNSQYVKGLNQSLANCSFCRFCLWQAVRWLGAATVPLPLAHLPPPTPSSTTPKIISSLAPTCFVSSPTKPRWKPLRSRATWQVETTLQLLATDITPASPTWPATAPSQNASCNTTAVCGTYPSLVPQIITFFSSMC